MNNTQNTKKPLMSAGANNVKINVVRIAILMIAVLMLLLGLINNGYKDVMSKSIRICYECIGIG